MPVCLEYESRESFFCRPIAIDADKCTAAGCPYVRLCSARGYARVRRRHRDQRRSKCPGGDWHQKDHGSSLCPALMVTQQPLDQSVHSPCQFSPPSFPLDRPTQEQSSLLTRRDYTCVPLCRCSVLKQPDHSHCCRQFAFPNSNPVTALPAGVEDTSVGPVRTTLRLTAATVTPIECFRCAGSGTQTMFIVCS